MPDTAAMTFEPQEAAYFLLGYHVAKGRKSPLHIRKHLRTAVEIFTGGAFNPLQVYEMQDAAKSLWLKSKE